MNNIKRFRKEAGHSICQIAKTAGLAPSYIANLEKGHRTNPTQNTMEKIAAVLEHTVSEIFFPDSLIVQLEERFSEELSDRRSTNENSR